jgi:dipeptidyl-peptidase 4
MSFTYRFVMIACLVTSWNHLLAQQDLTMADYQRAEKMLSYNTSSLVDRMISQPNWLTNDRFWYRILTPQGSEFILVDPVTGNRTAAFNQTKIAGALSSIMGRSIDPYHLPFNTFTFTPANGLQFNYSGKRYQVDLATYGVTVDSTLPRSSRPVRSTALTSVSPDGMKEVFIRNYNLWIRDLSTKLEMPLTTDGIKDFGYATDNAGWQKSDRPIVVWSPDSKKIATYQQDQRHVSNMYLVSTNVGAPRLVAWKYPLPGDSQVAILHRLIIDVTEPKIIPLKIAPGPHRGTLCDDISCEGKDFGDVNWSADGSNIAFVTTSRDHKLETMYIGDATTGTIREVFQENVATQFESGQGAFNWKYLPQTNEIIWYSERDNWGHLYLYDLKTGKVKNQITKGPWVVTEMLKVDEKKRMIYFMANGREAGNPYFSHFYTIGFDGKGLTLLTPEKGTHNIILSPTENYFFDNYSQPNIPPVTVLRDLNGKLVMTIEETDISRLKATGWKPPTPISVKSRDGRFDLYGLMFTPTHVDASKKYPVINYIYPGPQGGSMGGNWSFSPGRGDHQALAELGFVVVLIEGTCNPLRSKEFHDLCYGNMADNTLEDQVAGMRQLAAQYPYIDINRAGIWGHSGGGFATAAAMFRFPDFFKVGISESGNHDNRNYEDDWGERYNGLLKVDANGKSNYQDQANENYAKNLKGKLLLAHGLMDDNVPPQNTLLVVEALERANKDYDLIIFPNARHGYGDLSLYMMRRRWDYFVKNLLGVNPPKEYELKAVQDPRNQF